MSGLPLSTVIADALASNAEALARDFAAWVALVDDKPRRQRKPRLPSPHGLRTPAEAAARLGVSLKTLRGQVAAGELRYVAVSRGTKRPRKMFADSDLDQFIANQTRKDSPACPSSKTRVHHSGGSTSGSEVIAFSARRSAQPGAKRKR